MRKTKPSVNFSVRSSAVREEDDHAHVKRVTLAENHCDQEAGGQRGISKRSGLELISQRVCTAADSPVSPNVMTGQVRKGEAGNEGEGARN